jgi:gamma-glutamylcyclotransferase (GGCT)/AIG2-like uncharacterized protein YtfP
MKELKFLLPKDILKKEELELYIEENKDKKIPNKDVEVTLHIQFDIDCLKKDIAYFERHYGRPVSEDEFIKKHVTDGYIRYILDSYEFVGVFDNNKRFVGKMYEAQKQFIDALDKLEFFEKIENEMYNYFDNRFDNLDFRNLYQKRDGIYRGYRIPPLNDPFYDKRMLGQLVNGNLIMTTKEYHNQIRKIKKQLNATKQN